MKVESEAMQDSEIKAESGKTQNTVHTHAWLKQRGLAKRSPGLPTGATRAWLKQRGLAKRSPDLPAGATRAWLLVLTPVALLILMLAKGNPDLAERFFAMGFYRVASPLISRATALLPFSLLEFGIIALIILLIVFLTIFIRKVVKNRGSRKSIILKTGLNALCIASTVFFVFTVLCGVNYHRHPFSYYSGLSVQPSGIDELNSLCLELAAEANALYPQVVGEGGAIMYGGHAETSRAAQSAMRSLGERYPVLAGYYPPVKPVLFSGFMSRTQITGIYSPFTMEANVNTACTKYTIPATMCHELSHLRGFMREDEANFIAYLACMESDDPALRFSGTMLALVYSGNQLYSRQELYKALTETYSDGVKQAFIDDYIYWEQFDNTVISTVSSAVNDTYLKANSQADGVASYGRMVDLLLAYRRGAAS